MDIGMREILIVLGCLIMAVLFIDAYRRVRDHRRSQLGYRLNDQPRSTHRATLDGFDDDEDEHDELHPVRPVGESDGRIGRGPRSAAGVESSNAIQGQMAPAQSKKKGLRVRITTQKNPAGDQQALDGLPNDNSLSQTTDNSNSRVKGSDSDRPHSKLRRKDGFSAELTTKRTDGPIKALLQPALATAPGDSDFYSNRRNSPAAKQAARKVASAQTQEPLKAQTPVEPAMPEEVIMMHVVAGQDDMFDGEILVQNILALNMRHGDMKIFHRYERPEQHQGLLFSMANLVKPGYFELDHMNAFETPGVTFFLTLPCAGGALYAFDLMVDTARKLTKSLGGEFRDQSQSIITAQTVEHYRQKVMEFERKQRMVEKTRQIREKSKLYD